MDGPDAGSSASAAERPRPAMVLVGGDSGDEDGSAAAMASGAASAGRAFALPSQGRESRARPEPSGGRVLSGPGAGGRPVTLAAAAAAPSNPADFTKYEIMYDRTPTTGLLPRGTERRAAWWTLSWTQMMRKSRLSWSCVGPGLPRSRCSNRNKQCPSVTEARWFSTCKRI